MLEPRPLRNITHPFIDFTYIKKEFVDASERPEWQDILVIEAKKSDGAGKKDREKQFLSFLADLDLIRDEVEKKAGKFKRIDIKYR